MSDGVVIVGANLAGGRAAEQLRKLGYEERIVLVGEEPERPYDRPPLSKKALRGQVPEEKLYLRPLDYYDKHRIELELGVRATSLDPHAKTIALGNGKALRYHAAIIATGAAVRRLRCPGAELEGIHYVRTLADMRRLRAELSPGQKAVVIGAGVIGAETAASMHEEGLDVTMIETAEVPLARAFGAEVGALYASFHRKRGVKLHTGIGVEALRGDKRVQEVLTTDGRRFPCDLVVAGIGVEPEVGWLASAGVALEQGGLRVDDAARTSLSDVYGAGDVATFFHPGENEFVRVEAVDNAQLQAVVCAQGIMGQTPSYSPVPFFWSDQFNLKLQSVGLLSGYDDVVYRGSIESEAFVAFYLRGNELRAAVAVNRMKEIGVAKRILAQKAPIPDPRALSDEDFDLGTFAPRTSTAPGPLGS